MKMGFKHSRKWAVLLTLMIIIGSNFIVSEGATPFSSIEPGIRRLLQQDTSTYERSDIVRVDPLDHFKKYKGGYDITNKHYWSSAIFTGIYGYAIGALWLIGGALYSIYLLSTASCCGTKNRKVKKRKPCYKQCFLSPLILTTTFATLAIITSGVALGGNMRFHSRAKMIIGVIIDTAYQASNTIHNATGAMKEIGNNLQATNNNNNNAGVDSSSFLLVSTSDKIDYQVANIERQAQNNRHLVGRALMILYILTTSTISLNLASVIALTAFGILRFQRTVRMLITLCWLLTALCWVFFGAYFFLEKLSGDTCRALDEFQQNPENSSLSSILPCDELLSAKTILFYVGVGIYDIVNQVNANISLLRSNSFPEIEYVCNPFSGPPDYSYQPEKCSADTIQIGDIPQVLKLFTCSDTSGASCQQGEFITITQYNMIQAYTSSIQNLLDTYPQMQNLVHCQLVKDAFSDILVNHCKPLKRNVKTTWIAILLLSTVMVFLILLWASIAHDEQKHPFADVSVKPSLDSDEDKSTSADQV